MRVLSILESSALAGPHVYIANMIPSLVHVEMRLLIPNDASDELIFFLRNKDVHYNLIQMQHITLEGEALLRYLWRFPIEIISIIREINKYKPDIVYVAGGAWQFKSVIAGRLAKAVVVWHMNDSKMPLLIRTLFTLLGWIPKAYVYASGRTENYYSRLLLKNKMSQVIQSSVDINLFSPNVRLPADDYLQNISSDDFVVGTIANINPVKGLELLIDIAVLLENKYANVKFLIVGPVSKRQQKYYNSLVERMKKKLISSVEFVGGRSDVRPLLARFNVYLCVSRYESSPISLREALSMGKAVITTDVGDVSDYISNYCGCVEPSRDPSRFVVHLEKYILSSVHRKEASIEARRVALKNFQSTMCAQKHENFFGKILNAN
jgi:glycosyltransferase involved in cell wall biosynthesis